MFPPSPALSLVDSLDGIDDLEAYLDAQPALSRFPTPPARISKNAKGLGREPLTTVGVVTPQIRQEFDGSHCDDLQNGSTDYSTVAKAFRTALRITISPASTDISVIQDLLIRADLSCDLLAIALNILIAFRHHREVCLSEQDVAATSPACLTASSDSCSLFIISALSLAVSYTTDQPPPISWWVRHVGRSAWSGNSLHAVTLSILSALDWRLHSCTSNESLQRARTELSNTDIDADVALKSTPAVLDLRHRLKVDLLGQGLRSEADGGHAELGHGAGGCRTAWEHGLVTPDEEEQSVLSRFPSRATSVVALAATTAIPSKSSTESQFLQLL